MPSTNLRDRICQTCGASVETTGSGDFPCIACLLAAGLGEATEAVSHWPDALPDSLGAYLIERREDGSPWELGRGAMGVTYRARDATLQCSVALKIINADFAAHGAGASERFMREARAAASLRHPNVATIYQFGIDEETGQCFYAMELIDGETLEDCVLRSGPLPAATVVEIARQMVAALAVAEKQGVVHRDLKPGNVILTGGCEADKIAVKIIDFGLAKALGDTTDARVLTDGGFLGTPAFASPEQFGGAPTDVRSDIYSLGATLWYLLIGQVPFGDRAPARPPVEQLKAAYVPARFVALLARMVAKEPAARPGLKEIATGLESPSPRHALQATLAGAGLAIAAAIAFAFYSHFSPAPSPRDAVLREKSIAVLPFENLSDEKGSANFADGVQDELLTDLARIADLKVVSRTSVLQYRRGQPRNLREIGRQLRVAYIVEGTVQQIGRKVRIHAQLIDARTDLHRWAQTYDRPIDDVFAIQSEVAQTIAAQLDAKISPNEKAAIEEPPTHDLEAFDLYTRANQLLIGTSFNPRSKANLLAAAQLLAEAVAHDPNFLLAWCQLANAHDSLYFFGFEHWSWRLSLGEEAVNAALKLQPDAGEAHLARARHLYQGYLAYESALAELQIARRTLPNDPGVFTLVGYIARRQGKWQDSAREFENALALDPRNVFLLQQSALSQSLLRRYADAAIILDKALLIAPNNAELRLTRAQLDLDRQADTRPLHAVVATILAKNPAAGPDVAGAWLFDAFCERDQAEIDRAVGALGDGAFGPDAIQLRQIFWKGLAAKLKGDQAGAERAFAAARAEQERKVVAEPDFAPALCMLALMDAALGHKDEAIREGRRAVEMLPVTRDAINGAHMIEFLALTYAWSGEPDLACEQLELATKIPGTLSYGQLKLSPMWDDLRGKPRFEKIVASLAPES